MGSDDDNEECCADVRFNEDIEALRRACMLTGAIPSVLPSSPSPAETANSRGAAAATTSSFDSDADNDDVDGFDDLEFVRRLHQRFSADLNDGEEPLSLKPPSSIPSLGALDNYDCDFETLRAIQLRFAAYDDYDNQKESTGNSWHISEQVGVTNIAWEKECSNNLFVESSNAWGGFPNCVDNSSCDNQNVEVRDKCITQAQDTNLIEWHKSGVDDTAILPLKKSSFPRSALAFVYAIKKNRSCQTLLRSKLMHIEARMEEIKKLKDLVKILKSFQISCRKRTGRALSQKKDPRVQLISVPKIRANAKFNEKKLSAMYYGPLENCQVAKYHSAINQFPSFLDKESWTNEEKENLAKGVKQQFQEMLLQRSLDFVSGPDGSLGETNDLDSIFASIGDHDVTPESLRLFLPMVNWDQLASLYVPGRSGAECQARWLNCDDPLLNQNPWSKVEDKNLLHIIQQKGVSNWVDISVSLATNRTPCQCLTRYQRSLNASILKREWTEEEDNLLRAAIEAFGESNWQAVAFAMEGRTGAQCSNRWTKTLCPARKKVGKWTPDEDKHLKVAVMLFGPKTWNKIAQFVPGRTQVQCRERWVNALDPSLNRNPWTEEEDLKLNAAISEHGYCWSLVASCVPGRTDNQCWRRWKVLAPEEVPLLQEARKLQKNALISNFVDRESERPALGPNDFVSLPAITDGSENKNANPSVKQKKRLRQRKKTAVTEAGRPDTLEAMAYSKYLETSDSVILHEGGVDLSVKKRKSRRKPKSGNKTSAHDVLFEKAREIPSSLMTEHHPSCLTDLNSSVITNGEDVGELGRDDGGSTCHRKYSKLQPRRRRSESMEGNEGSGVSELYEDDQDATLLCRASESQNVNVSKQVKTIAEKKSNAKSTSKKSCGPGDVSDVQLSLVAGKVARKRKRKTAVGEDISKVTSPSHEKLNENAVLEEQISTSSEVLAIQSHDSHKSSKERQLLDKIIEEKEEDTGMTLASFLEKSRGTKKKMGSPVKVDELHKKGVEKNVHNLSTTNLSSSNELHYSRDSSETLSNQKYAEKDGDDMTLFMFSKLNGRKTIHQKQRAQRNKLIKGVE